MLRCDYLTISLSLSLYLSISVSRCLSPLILNQSSQEKNIFLEIEEGSESD